jgi:ATP-dependent helicase/nuclease subunit B
MVDLCSDEVPEDSFGEAVTDGFIQIVERLEASASLTENLDRYNLLKLAIDTAGEERFRGDINPDAVNLPGWQDAPWEPAPHLVVFGMNDNFVPGGKYAHPYLPASLRRELGLQTPEQLFANAAFIFEQLWRRRNDPKLGRLDVIVPQFSNEGEGLKPSRLLFLAPVDPSGASQDALLGPKGRIAKLFKELPQERALPYWEIPEGYRFDPRVSKEQQQKIQTKVSATSLSKFINNAPEYWLEKAVGMRENDHEALELSPSEFGNLVHGTLELYKSSPQAASLSDETKIYATLEKALKSVAEKSFGAKLPEFNKQVEVAAQRLKWLAAIEAKIAQEWETVAVEADLPELTVEGVKLYGRFDRLDRHKTDRNLWRVYDYKTSNDAKTPKAAHIAQANKNTKSDYIVKTGRDYRWKDVQLAVYEWCLLEGKIKDQKLAESLKDLRNGSAKVEVAYFNINSDQAETTLEVWKEFPDFREAGRAVITLAVKSLNSGKAEVYADAKISTEGKKHPLLPSLATRAREAYLQVKNLGQIR